MNFFDNIPNFNNPNQIQGMNNPMINPQMINNDINYKINELEQRIRKLELRISHLESEKTNNFIEPDTSMYMI